MLYQQLGLIAFGAILGFASSILAEKVRRCLDEKERRRRGKRLLSGIIAEAEEGIDRCRGYVHLLKEGWVSFSRIYVSFWESTKNELAQSIDDVEVLRLLNRIYYRFDLINFNMEREAFDVGGAMARDHLSEMEEDLSKAKDRFNSL